MSTVIRPELSKKNKYYIDKHRFYELKHFCLQYPLWKKALLEIDSMVKASNDILVSKRNEISDPVKYAAEAREYYLSRMSMVENAAYSASEEFYDYLLKAVTTGLSFSNLKTMSDIPCCKETYYEIYRKFFWLLDRARK